jgi:hypothetical protein
VDADDRCGTEGRPEDHPLAYPPPQLRVSLSARREVVRRLRRPAVAHAHVLPLPPDRERRLTDPGRRRARGRGCQRAAAARIPLQRDGAATARRRGDGAKASRGYGLPPERCSAHRADPSRPRPRGRDLRFPQRCGPRFRRRASGSLASVDAWRAKPVPQGTDRCSQEMGGGRGRRRILVWLFGRARHSRNTRRGAAGTASWSLARALRRRGQACGRLVAPLRDAYFHHSEVEPDGDAAPRGLRFFESLVEFDGAQRRANQARLRELARLALGEVKLICSHDLVDFAAMRSEAREARPAPASSSASVGRRVARGGASGPAKRRSGIAAIGGSRAGSARAGMNQSAPVVLPLSALTAPRRVFSSTRRTLEARVGRVARRRFGRT